MRFLWILVSAVLVGCTVSGGYVPVAPIEMKKDMVDEYSISTPIYVEPITGRGSISKKFLHRSKELPVIFNLDEMSMYVANSLSAELVKKGADLNRDAEKVIRIQVLDVNMSYSTNYQVEGTVEFQLSDGYVGSCNFGGTGVKAYRALGGALQWGVANIANHNNVHSFLSDKDTQAYQIIPGVNSRPELPDYEADAKYKLAILPFKADSLDNNYKYLEKAIGALIECTNEIEDIALTQSWYGFKNNNTGDSDTVIANPLCKMEKVDFWDKTRGKYAVNEKTISKCVSMLNIDLVFTCNVSCKKTGLYDTCGAITIDTYLFSVADNKMYHENARMDTEFQKLKSDLYFKQSLNRLIL